MGMATFRTTSNKPRHMSEAGCANIYADKATVSGTATSGDLIVPCVVPGGNEITDLEIINDDIDSGTGAVQCKVGYRYTDGSTGVVNPDGTTGPDDAYFFATSSTFLRGAARTKSASKPIRFDRDVEILVTITATSSGASAGDVHAIVKGIGHGIRGT